MQTEEDRYLTLSQLANYTTLSERTLRRALTAPRPLPHVRVGSKVLVKRSAFDRWAEAARDVTEHDPEIIEAARGIRGY
jgi:excisionase family DNA binding protein